MSNVLHDTPAIKVQQTVTKLYPWKLQWSSLLNTTKSNDGFQTKIWPHEIYLKIFVILIFKLYKKSFKQ